MMTCDVSPVAMFCFVSIFWQCGHCYSLINICIHDDSEADDDNMEMDDDCFNFLR